MFKILSKAQSFEEGKNTNKRYETSNYVHKSPEVIGAKNNRIYNNGLKCSSTEPNNRYYNNQNFRTKVLSQKYKNHNNKLTKISSMSLYEPKDKAEKFFSNKIKNIIESDPSLKQASMSCFCQTTRDKWKPEGYIYYDFLLKHPLMMGKDKLNHKMGITPTSPHPLGKNSSSHIFEESKLAPYKPIINESPKSKYYYTPSDVFNLNRENPELLHRSGEKYLFTGKSLPGFCTTTESHSDWIPKSVKKPTLLNYTSVKWNIICPGSKSLFKTKSDVNEEVKEYYKVNSLSEFVDRTRVSAPNLNKVYREAMEKDKKCFGLKNDIASNYGDMHHSYREMFPKCFWK